MNQSVQYWNLLFCSSSCCQTCFPSSDKWMDCGKWGWRFSFDSPEKYAPSSSRCIFAVNDDEDTLLSSVPHIRRKRKNVSPIQYRSNSLLQHLIGMQNLLHSIVTHLVQYWSSGISASFKYITNFIWSMRNPGVIVVCLNSTFIVQTTGCNFQYGSNFSVPLDPSFRLWCSSSLGRVCFHDKPLHENCENSAVSFVMKYCLIWTRFRNPASIQNLLNLSCCDSFSIRSPYCWKKILICWILTFHKNFCLDRTEHEWRTWLSHHNKSNRSLFTFLCDCSVKNWAGLQKQSCEKKSQSFPGRLHSVSTSYNVLCFSMNSGQWSRSTEIGHPLPAKSKFF